MALVHNGTVVNIPSAQLPSGYSKPAVSQFTDYEQEYTSRAMTILKSLVENATAVTTMQNLITQLNTDIETLLTADFNVAALTVTSYATLNSLSTNNNLAGVLFTNGALSYVLTVDIFVKTA